MGGLGIGGVFGALPGISILYFGTMLNRILTQCILIHCVMCLSVLKHFIVHFSILKQPQFKQISSSHDDV